MTKTLQIRLEEGLRSEADKVLQEIGLDLPSAVRLFLTRVVRTRGIPFELTADRPRVVELPADAAMQAKMDEIGARWGDRKARRRG